MIGSILHQSGIGIWDNTPGWTIQTGINIEYTSGDAIIGSGADFTLVAGSNYNVDAIVQFKVSGLISPLIIGHGIAKFGLNTIDLKTADTIVIQQDGIHTLRYSGIITGDVENLYNVFTLIVDNNAIPEILDVEKLAVVFRSI